MRILYAKRHQSINEDKGSKSPKSSPTARYQAPLIPFPMNVGNQDLSSRMIKFF